jgi:hypothetical protein
MHVALINFAGSRHALLLLLLALGACAPTARAACAVQSSPVAHNHVSASFGAPADGAAAPYSIALWGDSLTASRDFIDAALGAHGIAAATVLPSYIAAGMQLAGRQASLKASCATEGWQTAYAYKEKAAGAEFSKGMLSMRAQRPGEMLALDFRAPTPSTRVRQLTMFYDKPQPDSSLLLAVSADNGAETLISLTAKTGHSVTLLPDQPLATLRLRVVSGSMTLHGFAPQYVARPRLLLDVFSVPGSVMQGWSKVGQRFAGEPGAALDYRMVLVQYGTNEGAASDFTRAVYERNLRSSLGRLRQVYPRARCVLIGPPDRGVSAGGGAPLKFSNVHHQIAMAQREIASEFTCEFWDWQAAMGGAGSALRWSRLTPPQMQQDLTHLTAKGYQLSGQMFADDIPLSIP